MPVSILDGKNEQYVVLCLEKQKPTNIFIQSQELFLHCNISCVLFFVTVILKLEFNNNR